MHRYLLEYFHMFDGYKTFTVVGADRSDAIAKGEEYLILHEHNHLVGSVTCIKKLKGVVVCER